MTHAQNMLAISPYLGARLHSVIERFRTNRARRAAFNRAYGELQMLSDRELVEFGLHRSDLVTLAWEEANRS